MGHANDKEPTNLEDLERRIKQLKVEGDSNAPTTKPAAVQSSQAKPVQSKPAPPKSTQSTTPSWQTSRYAQPIDSKPSFVSAMCLGLLAGGFFYTLFCLAQNQPSSLGRDLAMGWFALFVATMVTAGASIDPTIEESRKNGDFFWCRICHGKNYLKHDSVPAATARSSVCNSGPAEELDPGYGNTGYGRTSGSGYGTGYGGGYSGSRQQQSQSGGAYWNRSYTAPEPAYREPDFPTGCKRLKLSVSGDKLTLLNHRESEHNQVLAKLQGLSAVESARKSIPQPSDSREWSIDLVYTKTTYGDRSSNRHDVEKIIRELNQEYIKNHVPATIADAIADKKWPTN